MLSGWSSRIRSIFEVPPAADRDDLGHLLEIGDLRSVDGRDAVAGLDAGRLRRTALDHIADDGRQHGMAIVKDQAGEKQDGQNEIGDRSGGGDRGALPEWLEGQGLSALGLAHSRCGCVIRHAGGIGVAGEFHITADGQPAHLPAGAAFVGPAENLLAETDREDIHLHAAGARHQEMTEFVEEHHHRDDEQKGGEPQRGPGDKTAQWRRAWRPLTVPTR